MKETWLREIKAGECGVCGESSEGIKWGVEVEWLLKA